MAQPTAKAVAAEERRVTLLLRPRTPQQRALRSCDGTRPDQRRAALQLERAKHGADAPMAWLHPYTGTITPTEETP